MRRLIEHGITVARAVADHLDQRPRKAGQRRRVQQDLGDAHRHGVALGLTPAETWEVVYAWAPARRADRVDQLDRIDWHRVDLALTSRALGDEWRPPKERP
jgi:hypothetical protein